MIGKKTEEVILVCKRDHLRITERHTVFSIRATSTRRIRIAGILQFRDHTISQKTIRAKYNNHKICIGAKIKKTDNNVSVFLKL